MSSHQKLEEKPGTLRELRHKINEINLSIQNSQQKMESITGNLNKDRPTTRLQPEYHLQHKTTIDHYVQPLLETTSRLVDQKNMELRIAQQRVEDAIINAEQIKKQEATMSDRQIQNAIEVLDRM